MTKRNFVRSTLLFLFIPVLGTSLWWYLIPGIITISTKLNREIATLWELHYGLVPMVGYVMAALTVTLAVSVLKKLKCSRDCGLLWTYGQMFLITLAGSAIFALVAIMHSVLTNTSVAISWPMSLSEVAMFFSETSFVPLLVQINSVLFTFGFIIATIMGLKGELRRSRQ